MKYPCDICKTPVLKEHAFKTKHSNMVVCGNCAAKVKGVHDYIISPNREPIVFQSLTDIESEEEILCQIK